MKPTNRNLANTRSAGSRKFKSVIIAAITGVLMICLCACACTGLHPIIDGPGTTGPDDTTTPGSTTTTPPEQTEDPTMDIDGFRLEGNDGEGPGAADNTSGLTYFYYGYGGSIGGNDYSYTVYETDGTVTFEYSSMEYTDDFPISIEVDSSVLDDLNQLYLDLRLAEWNGYSKYAPDVLDGDGFNLMMEFEDEGRFFASGTNAYPERYFDFCSRMQELLEPFAQQVRDANRDAKISEGVKGDLRSVMVDFTQHGTSGSDKYSFFIVTEGAREKNFDVQITSESGEFFEKGNHNYYCYLPNEAIDFDGVKQLIEKYDIVQWIDYDEDAEDYMNSEWFQVSFGFEHNSINAMGTEHPEHYDEFRKEFLELMAKMIEKAKKDYGLEEH